MSDHTFGNRARELRSATDLLTLENTLVRTEYFSAVDTVVSGIMIRAFRGERVVRLSHTRHEDQLNIVGMPESLRSIMCDAFQLEAQQSRGAWFLPETVPIKVTYLLFPALFREYPRYSHTLAAREKGKIALNGNPDAMVVWSVLQSLAETLVAPITFRIAAAGTLSRDEFVSRWNDVTAPLTVLGLSVATELAPLAWGGGWGRSGTDAQLQVTAQLLDSIGRQLGLESIRRYRASMVMALIAQYYTKAKNGRAKRKQVITKDYARTLAAFFHGDWPAFVNYLGEELHEDERITTSLPEPRLAIQPVDESGSPSPMVERTSLMWHYWGYFDALHAKQAPGMPSLWGLVEEDGCGTCLPATSSSYTPQLYRSGFPPDLLQHVEALWGTTVLSKWPECVVSEPFPHSAMSQAFGAALAFWHGCGLTAWFICEGPMSRTDIPGLASYYSRPLAELESMGCPVHPQLFSDLQSVRLGKEEPIYSNRDQLDVGSGFSLDVRFSSGTRRKGFGQLRDVITRHRQWWASQYLQRYLQLLWETELTATARQYHLMSEQKGKPPTLKQFAKHAIAPARHWFAGDIGRLLGSVGLACSPIARRGKLMPDDRAGFTTAVFATLGGRPIPEHLTATDPSEVQYWAAERDRQRCIDQLAVESLRFVQLSEALEREPTPAEFGSRFVSLGKVLSPDQDTAWTIYRCAIERTLQRPR